MQPRPAEVRVDQQNLLARLRDPGQRDTRRQAQQHGHGKNGGRLRLDLKTYSWFRESARFIAARVTDEPSLLQPIFIIDQSPSRARHPVAQYFVPVTEASQ